MLLFSVTTNLCLKFLCFTGKQYFLFPSSSNEVNAPLQLLIHTAFTFSLKLGQGQLEPLWFQYRVGFSGIDQCKSCLPLTCCFSPPFSSKWFPNATFVIGLSQIRWRYIISGCKHRVFHRFLPVLASPGLSCQTIYEISWVMKEALYTRKVLERSWKVYLVLSTHIFQRLMYRQTHWSESLWLTSEGDERGHMEQMQVSNHCLWAVHLRVPLAEPEKRTIMSQNWPDTQGASAGGCEKNPVVCPSRLLC